MEVFEEIARAIAPILVQEVKAEITAQGHKLTGSLVDSVEAKIEKLSTGAQVQIWLNDYGQPLNTGVPAARIPYTPYSGAKVSKYIQGLIIFARLRFRVPPVEAKSIAFAIANKHKQKGMPTPASKRFSKTGKRTKFLQDAVANAQPDIESQIDQAIERAAVQLFAVLTEATF